MGKRRLYLVVRPWDADAATENLRFELLEEKNLGARLAHGENIVLDGSECMTASSMTTTIEGAFFHA